MTRAPIYRVGSAGAKQAAQRPDGQWFYRLRICRIWGRWIKCSTRPEGAWYDPRAGRAILPTEKTK